MLPCLQLSSRNILSKMLLLILASFVVGTTVDADLATLNLEVLQTQVMSNSTKAWFKYIKAFSYFSVLKHFTLKIDSALPNKFTMFPTVLLFQQSKARLLIFRSRLAHVRISHLDKEDKYRAILQKSFSHYVVEIEHSVVMKPPSGFLVTLAFRTRITAAASLYLYNTLRLNITVHTISIPVYNPQDCRMTRLHVGTWNKKGTGGHVFKYCGTYSTGNIYPLGSMVVFHMAAISNQVKFFCQCVTQCDGPKHSVQHANSNL